MGEGWRGNGRWRKGLLLLGGKHGAAERDKKSDENPARKMSSYTRHINLSGDVILVYKREREMEGFSGELKAQVYDQVREEKDGSETHMGLVTREAVLLT